MLGQEGRQSRLRPTPPEEKPWPAPGPATQLQIIPSEVLLHPGEKATFRVRSLDANGFTVEESIAPKQVKWASYVPPTAKVKATMKGAFNADGELRGGAGRASPRRVRSRPRWAT